MAYSGVYSRELDYTFMVNNPGALDGDGDLWYNTEDEIALHTENATTDIGSETDPERHTKRDRDFYKHHGVPPRGGISMEAIQANQIRAAGLSLADAENRNVRNKPPAHHIYVLFKRVASKSKTPANCNQYLVNNIQPLLVNNKFSHVEMFFCNHNTVFVSAMNLNGVTFIENKKYIPGEYTDIFDIEISAGKYGMALDYARKVLGGREYDDWFYYCFCCIACNMSCNWESRRETHTCSSAVAALLTYVGIGANDTRAMMLANKNITPDEVYHLMKSATDGLIPISKRIVGIEMINAPADEFLLYSENEE
jgi:hypothetical protein